MRAGDFLGQAWGAMTQHRLRAALATLGMVFGVAAIVLTLALGEGTRSTVSRSIESIGANLFIILSGASTSGGLRIGTGTLPTLTVRDADAISTLSTITTAAPVHPGNAQLVYGKSNWNSLVYGTTPNFFGARSWQTVEGTLFTDDDVRSAARVVVLGRTVVENLFGGMQPVGHIVRIQGAPFRVIGVLESKGQSLDGKDQDDGAYVPVTTSQRELFGVDFPGAVRFILAQGSSSSNLSEAQSEMRALLRQRHRLAADTRDDFTIRDITAVAHSASATATALSLMIAAIASVSVMVGGIGITNIMLVSVTERTREIGLRMALGARRSEIRTQFLLEAVMISALGGIAGLALGIGASWLLATMLEIEVVVSLSSILLALGFSSLVGILFGFLPAHRASRLQPADALRHS